MRPEQAPLTGEYDSNDSSLSKYVASRATQIQLRPEMTLEEAPSESNRNDRAVALLIQEAHG